MAECPLPGQPGERCAPRDGDALGSAHQKSRGLPTPWCGAEPRDGVCALPHSPMRRAGRGQREGDVSFGDPGGTEGPRAPWDGGERWCRDPLGNLGVGVGCWPWCPCSSPSSPSPAAGFAPTSALFFPRKGAGGCDLLQPTVH